MHRFQLVQKGNTGAETMKTYALMNGVYDGGNDYEISRNGIQCEIDSDVGKFFRLVVKDGDVKLAIMSNMQQVSLTLKHGDAFKIGRDRFELIKHERTMNQKGNCSSGCCHSHNPLDERKAINRVDCPYPDGLFACWCIADLNEHIVSDDGHQGQLLPRPRSVDVDGFVMILQN